MALCQKSSLPMLVGMPLGGWMDGRPCQNSSALLGWVSELPCIKTPLCASAGGNSLGVLGCPVSEPRRDAAPGQISSLLVGMSLDGWLHRNLR